MTTATAPVITRETLEDRYEGLMLAAELRDGRWGNTNSGLFDRLDDALCEIVQMTSRFDPINENAFDRIRMNLHETIRTEVVRLLDENGIAER